LLHGLDSPERGLGSFAPMAKAVHDRCEDAAREFLDQAPVS